MKRFLKTFFIVIILLVLITASGFAIFKAVYTPSHLREADNNLEDIIIELPDDKPVDVDLDEEEEVVEKTEDELWIDAIRASDRVNVLIIGTDGVRADTLIVMSYSKEDEDVTMISVPRDTKNVVEGKTGLGTDKINAVYGFGQGMGGPDNQLKAVESLVGVPLHYYVRVNYNGLKAIVNTIGGVEIYVPFDMKYDDTAADPPLHIDLKEGTQVLDGDKAMQFIRWRKNNDGTGDSDLARQKRQQEFIIKVVKKSFGLDILKVINLCYDYVRTDMSVEDMLYYGSEMIGFDFSTINTHGLPGEADYRYFYQDREATKLLMQQIYGFK